MNKEKFALLDELDYYLTNYKDISYGNITKIMNKIALLRNSKDKADVSLILGRVSNYIQDAGLLAEIIKFFSSLQDESTSNEAIAILNAALCYGYFGIGFDYKAVEYGLRYVNSGFSKPNIELEIYKKMAISCFELEEYSDAIIFLERSHNALLIAINETENEDTINKYKVQDMLFHVNKAMILIFLNDTITASEEIKLYNDIWANSLVAKYKKSYSLLVKFYNIYLKFVIGTNKEESAKQFVDFMLNKYDKARYNVALNYKQYAVILNYMYDNGQYDEVLKICRIIKKTRAYRGSSLVIELLEIKTAIACGISLENFDIKETLLKYEREQSSSDSYQKSIMRGLIADSIKDEDVHTKYSAFKQQLSIDPVTSTYNRLGLELNASKYMKDKDGCLIFIDLDGLKKINDFFGHETGDRYLQEFAAGAISACENNGEVYRYGGDEFVIITKYAGNCSEEIIEQMKRIFSIPFIYNGTSFYIRFSYGIANYHSNSVSIANIIKEADRRMYGLKQKRYSDECSDVGGDQISFFFNQLIENLAQCAIWSDKILHFENYEDWVLKLREKSRVYKLTFKNYESFVDSIVVPLAVKDFEINDKIANSIYDEVITFDTTKPGDYIVLSDFSMLLINYYKEKNDVARLIRLYFNLGRGYISAIYLKVKVDTNKVIDMYKSILSYKGYYASLDDLRDRRIFFDAYYDLILKFTYVNLIPFEKMYSIYEEMMEFYNSDLVQSVDKDSLVIKEIVQSMKIHLISSTIVLDSAPTAVKEKIYEMAEKEYEDEMSKKGQKIYYEVYSAHLLALRYYGKITYNQVVYQLLEYYKKRKPLCMAFNGIDSNYYFNAKIPSAIALYFLDKTTISTEEKNKIRMDMIREKHHYLASITSSKYKDIIDKEIVDFATKTLKYIKGDENQEKYAKQYIIKKQFETDAHSIMVQRLALYLTNKILEKNPSYFVGELYSSIDDVNNHKDEIIDFVSNAAMIHDVGKILVSEITNIKYRRLTINEYEVTKTHCQIGYDLFSKIKAYEPYLGVILNHHLSYNKEFGYAGDTKYDDTLHQEFIDLISLCDALDNYTDVYNCNYQNPKNVEKTINDLKEGSGNRFNPKLVDLIVNNEDIVNDINNIIIVERPRIYFKIFQEFSK